MHAAAWVATRLDAQECDEIFGSLPQPVAANFTRPFLKSRGFGLTLASFRLTGNIAETAMLSSLSRSRTFTDACVSSARGASVPRM